MAEALRYRVTVLRAPAGYGKSVALADAIDGAGIPALRYSPPSQTDSLGAFVRGLANALSTIAPAARLSFAGAWERAADSPAPAEQLARWLLAHIGETKATIVLDQLHVAASTPKVDAFITHLIEASPETLRWMLAVRDDMDLPFPRWLADGLIGVPLERDALEFKTEDVINAARVCGTPITLEEAQQICERTGGWPMGVMFALRKESALPPEADPVLAQRIFADRTDRERQFLLRTCLLPDLDEALCVAAGFDDSADLLRAMAPDAGFMFSEEERLRYRDRFAAFLRAELEAEEKGELSPALQAAARALQANRRIADALRLLTSHGARNDLAALVENYGLEMLRTEDEDAVQSAMTALGAPDETWSPRRLALKAIFEYRAGRTDTADSWLALALEGETDAGVRATIAYRSASEMLQRRPLEAIALLEPYAQESALSETLRISMLSALGSAYMNAGRPMQANECIWYAMGLAENLRDDAVLAPLLVRAAYVALYSQSTSRARDLAQRGAVLAERTQQFTMAFGAYSTLYAIAADEDDPEECARALRHLGENAAKSGNPHMQQYALMAQYELEMERGDEAATARIHHALQFFDLHYEERDATETILPSRALELAMHGEFREAYRLLSPSAQRQSEGDRAALRWAEVSLYAAAAGERKTARQALSAVRKILRQLSAPSVRSYRAQLFCALALHLLKKRAALRVLAFLDGGWPSERLRAMFAAVRELMLAGEQPPREYSAIEALWQAGAGGFAKALLALCPPAVAHAPAFLKTVRRRSASPLLLDEIDAKLTALIGELDVSNPLTAEHSRAVSSWCARLARKMGLNAEEIVAASRSGLIHDIGKLRTPADILNAARSLTAAEWEIMRAHALCGHEIVKEHPALHHLGPAVRSHHERIDGKGYPDGLARGSIPFIARLVAVADSFNAMIGRRPYRKPMPPSVAIMELERHRGTQFDPEIVDAMIAVVEGSPAAQYI
jgi:HD-GYP domain-containing protein (c-di-GMP phosphodiesterase class II)